MDKQLDQPNPFTQLNYDGGKSLTQTRPYILCSGKSVEYTAVVYFVCHQFLPEHDEWQLGATDRKPVPGLEHTPESEDSVESELF